MDPNKSFDHLDPKLKETYARVMGTNTNGSAQDTSQPVPNTAAPSTNPDPNQLSSSPFGTPPSQDPTTTTGQATDANAAAAPAFFNPTPMNPQQTPDTTPATFFSNPSPATTEPAQNAPAVGADPAPVTPYSPEEMQTPQTDYSQPMSQPLPSPSSVNQPHETSSLLKVIYIVIAVIFFICYTIFWLVIFHIPLPFSL